MRTLRFFVFILVFLSCTEQIEYPVFDIQGHRGCRGLFPENSLPGFIRALELGVNTLELDLVVSKDSQVVVSHEPWLSSKICLTPDGDTIAGDDRDQNMYKLDYAEIRRYDCGSIGNESFLEQKKLRVFKPLLSEVFEVVEAHLAETGSAHCFYNIEIKRKEGMDDVFHPDADVFVGLVMEVVQEYGLEDRVTIQSFDTASLESVQRNFPEMRTAYLIANRETPVENLSKLSFTPDIYSPYFLLVDEGVISKCQQQGIKVIPWTVNEEINIKKMIDLGVDGIISDYPDRVIAMYRGLDKK